MNETNAFAEQVRENISKIGNDGDFLELSDGWLRAAIRHQYAQNFSWLGRPIMQIPQDIYAIQELIWSVRPDLIIETGIAHGGSLIMSASMLALLNYCDAIASGQSLDPRKSQRKVLGVDIQIRAHNRGAIENHPLAHLIEMIEGSSIEPMVVDQIKDRARGYKRILVFLDSNHTHDHVFAELEAYAPLTSVGSYCVVWDTGVEDLPADFCADRPWNKGNNPKTAVWEYLRTLEESPVVGADGVPIKFEIDKVIEHKIVITASPEGFLKRIG